MFDPEKEVKALGYDFTTFGGERKIIDEPSDAQVSKFWAESFKDVKARIQRPEDPKPPDEESDAERDERLRNEALEQLKRDSETLSRRRELLSALCSDSPSVEELEKLPHRVFVAFEGYVIGALRPEALRTASTP